MRRLVVGLVIPIAFATALAGCGKSTSNNTGSAGSSQSPTAPAASAVLAAAVLKSASTNFKFTLGDPSKHADGVYNAESKAVQFHQSTDKAGALDLIVIGDDMYLSGLSVLEGKTWHLDAKKLTSKNAFTVFADPLASLAFLSTASSVTQDKADGTYRGTFDPSKISTANAATKKVVDLLVEKQAGKAGPIPFTAKVDSEGRLEKFTMLFPGLDDGKDSTYELVLSDFGTTARVTKPTRNVIEAPDIIYST
jgi:hypothetical protein